MNNSTVVKNTGRPKPPNAGKGRKKGVPNKLTSSVKEMILAALESAGGMAYLVEQAQTNPSAFLALLGRLLPTELRAELTGTIQTGTSFDDIMKKAILVEGGWPDWEIRLEIEIGRLFLKHRRGEPLPEHLVVGGMRYDENGALIDVLGSEPVPAESGGTILL